FGLGGDDGAAGGGLFPGGGGGVGPGVFFFGGGGGGKTGGPGGGGLGGGNGPSPRGGGGRGGGTREGPKMGGNRGGGGNTTRDQEVREESHRGMRHFSDTSYHSAGDLGGRQGMLLSRLSAGDPPGNPFGTSTQVEPPPGSARRAACLTTAQTPFLARPR